MKAETALNVIEALSPDEAKRLFSMLGVAAKEPKPKRKKILLTDAQATEYLINLYKRKTPVAAGGKPKFNF